MRRMLVTAALLIVALAAPLQTQTCEPEALLPTKE